MAFLRNLLLAARPLADERPYEPLIRPRQIHSGEHCMLTMACSSTHPVQQAQPLRWDDATRIVDFLKKDGITVFSLSFLPLKQARQFLDFLCGAAMIQRAGLYRIAEQTYLLTPQGVPVEEPLLRKLEDEGFYIRDSQIQRQRLA